MRNNPTPARSVVIIQRVLPHYRLPFFERLHDRLREGGIDLRLIYGQEYPGTVPVTVNLEREWATRIHNQYLRFPSLNLVWQPCLDSMGKPDLVIVEQANSLLLNYWLLAARAIGIRKLAYWGHGQNFQAGGRGGLRETLKSALIIPVDWWFAYTQLSAAIVQARGYSSERITIVNNAIDTAEFRVALESVGPDEITQLKRNLGISGDHVGIYCGGLYADKKLDFLLESCRAIRRHVENFHLIVIGSGPEQEKITRAAAENPWIHYVGAQFGRDRATYFKAAKIFMMPGLVGLAILDAFAAETPLFTTDIPIHSPEVAYLDQDVNGVMTAPDTEAYALAVADYFASPTLQQNLRQGCRDSAQQYRLDGFVENFANGIESCLSHP
jgi:glycosyltransferase involved in cell wall biosynthesis